MKWVKEDHKGNKQVWYSEDLIEVLKECCKERQFLSSDMIMRIIKDYSK